MKKSIILTCIIIVSILSCTNEKNNDFNTRYFYEKMDKQKSTYGFNQFNVETRNIGENKEITFTIINPTKIINDTIITDEVSIELLKSVFSETEIDSTIMSAIFTYVFNFEKTSHLYTIDEIYYYISEVEYGNSDYKMSERLMSKAIKINQVPIYYKNRGFANYRLKNYKAAEKDFLEYIKLSKQEDLQTLVFLARCYMNQDMEKENITLINKIKKSFPSYEKINSIDIRYNK